MVWQKILFLLFFLVFDVKALEIYNDGRDMEQSWYRDWRKPVTIHPAKNNQRTLLSTPPPLSINEEPSTTRMPEHSILEITNSSIDKPGKLYEMEELHSSSISPIQTLIEIPSSTTPTILTTTEELLVETKPSHRMFNFGVQEASQKPTDLAKESTSAVSWNPERISEFQLPSSSQELPAIIKSQEPVLETKPVIHHTFTFESSHLSYPEVELSKTTPSKLYWFPEIIAKTEPPSMLTTEISLSGIKPDSKSVDFGAPPPSYREMELPKTSSSKISWVPEIIVKSKTSIDLAISSTISPTEKPILEMESTQNTLNFKPTQVEFNTEREQPKETTSLTSSDIVVESLTLQTSPDMFKEGQSPTLGVSQVISYMNSEIPPSPRTSNPEIITESMTTIPDLNKERTQPAFETELKYRTFNFGSISPDFTTSITHPTELVSEQESYHTETLAITEIPRNTELHTLESKIPASILSDKNGKYATEIEFGAPPTLIENSPGFIVYRLEQPLLPQNLVNNFVSSAHPQEFKCQAKNGYYEVVSNCDKFVECKDNVLKLYQCSNNLHFNRKAVWPADPCDEPSLAYCKIEEIQLASKIEHEPEPKLSANFISSHFDFLCPENTGYYKHNSDCEEFIKCEESIASLYKCSSGLQFNHDATWGQDPCADEKIIRCYSPVLQPRSEPNFSADLITRQIANYECTSSEGYFKLGKDCDMFIKCEKSSPSAYKCWQGLQFNVNATRDVDPCASKEIIGCVVADVESNKEPVSKFSAIALSKIIYDFTCPANNGYFESKNECEEFIKCENAVASLYKCLPGLRFNRNYSWGEDPCETEAIVTCKPVVLEGKPLAPKFSATMESSRVIDFSCPANNGYFETKNECEKFIKCENAVASLYKCLPGLQFNRRSSLEEDPCDSETIIGCKPVILEPKPMPPKFSATVETSVVIDFSCPANNGYFETKNECEKFIKCDNAVAALYKCLPGLQFNRRSSLGEDPCESEENIGCKPVILEPKPMPPKFSAAVETSVVIDFSCPANNGYFESKNECEKFIKCENFMATSYKCWSGLQFNPQASWGQDPCASASAVGCKAVDIPSTSTPKQNFSAILISSPHMDYRCEVSRGYFSIENNCERFIECEMFVPSLYMCPNGQQFNTRARFGEEPCASASIVQCEVKTTTPSVVETAMTTTTSVQVLSYTLILKNVLGYTCAAATGYYNVKDECDQFIACKNYIPSLYRCNSGLHFNQNVMRDADPCAQPSVARCEKYLKRPLGVIENDDTQDGFQCMERDGIFPFDTLECSKYIMCEKGMATVMPCPPGLVFNPELETCDWPVNVPTCNPELFQGFSCPAPENDEYGSISDKITTFKYEESCTQYIACQHGHPRLLSCDKGLSFSEEIQACVSTENVLRCRN